MGTTIHLVPAATGCRLQSRHYSTSCRFFSRRVGHADSHPRPFLPSFLSILGSAKLTLQTNFSTVIIPTLFFYFCSALYGVMCVPLPLVIILLILLMLHLSKQLRRLTSIYSSHLICCKVATRVMMQERTRPICMKMRRTFEEGCPALGCQEESYLFLRTGFINCSCIIKSAAT